MSASISYHIHSDEPEVTFEFCRVDDTLWLELKIREDEHQTAHDEVVIFMTGANKYRFQEALRNALNQMEYDIE